jgi:OmpA-OmpF porin, OOP family
MKKVILSFLLAFSLSFYVSAQNDVEGCKDHPLLTRMQLFYIIGCSENYNELQVRTSATETVAKEGNLFSIDYDFNFDAGEKMRSPLQIIKNYETAIVKNGGKLIYKNLNGMEADIEATLYLSTREKEYWVKLSGFAGNGIEVEAFKLNVLEIEAMQQEVGANEMYEAIAKDGFVALYINFETGKSTIKPESESVIAEIAAMLKQNPNLKVSVEGHTDNVGNLQSNQTLSESRANAVMKALVAQGVDASRMKYKGWGQTKPIGSNDTEEGRAKNRRVEIVKI